MTIAIATPGVSVDDEMIAEAFARSRTFNVAYTAEPTAALFHRSEAFYKSIRGPLGSGKSVCCLIELLRRAREQEPDARGMRRTRWGVIRNTYPMLESTTIKTWQDWVPEEIAPVKHSPLLSCRLRIQEADGTTVDCEVFFVSMDKPDDIAKLKSMDLTGIWLNEVSELPKSTFDMATARVGRFPPKNSGVHLTWCGIISDTNSMDDEHWHCKLEEGVNDDEEVKELNAQLREALLSLGFDRPLMEFYVQPPALLEANGTLIPNPYAENARNHHLGHAYWLNMVAGKDQNWINVYILNRHGRVIDGLPCYPEYIPEIHGKRRALTPFEGLPIDLGMDFGLSPAIVPIQCTPEGILLVLGELCAEERSMGTRSFVRDAMSPYLTNRFGTHHKFKIIGDPAGSGRDDSDENTSYKELASAGYDFEQGKTNDWIPRRESVAWFLGRIIKGQPAFQMDESCKLLRAGFEGRYHYRRLRVAGEPRYEEKAYKNKWSHCLAEGTLVTTPAGDRKIESIRKGDTVLASGGWRLVERAWLARRDADVIKVELSSGRTLLATPDHLIFANGCWVRADAIQYGDVLNSIGENKCQQVAHASTKSSSSWERGTTANPAGITKLTIDMAGRICTGLFGLLKMATSLQGTISTTSTRTRLTTSQRILNASRAPNTRAITRLRTTGETLKKWASALRLRAKQPLFGTDLRRVSNFINDLANSRGKSASVNFASALNAIAGFGRLLAPQSADFAPHHVRPARAERAALTTRQDHALFVAGSSGSTNTQRQSPAVRVVRIARSQERKNVFDLTVAVDHDFYAEGVLVHNCQDALQYAAMNYATVGLQEMKLLSTPRWMQKLNVRGSAVRPYQMRGGSFSHRRYSET